GGTPKRPSASAGCWTAYSGTFQELETVAEWVVNVHVLVARERLSVDDLVTGAAKPGHEGFQVRHQQARMRFPSWAHVGVNAKMNFHGCALEPNATAHDEMIGLRSLRNAQKARVEETSLLLPSRGHCQLNMIYANDCQSGLLLRSGQRCGSAAARSAGGCKRELDTASLCTLSPSGSACLALLFDWWTASAIPRPDLESSGNREECFVRPDAGHELDGERQPIVIEAPRQSDGRRSRQVPEAGQASQADDVAMVVCENRDDRLIIDLRGCGD